MTALAAARERSRAIAAETPQWRPFLGLLDRALAEAASGTFDALRVERTPSAVGGEPFLLGARLVLPRDTTLRWLAHALPRRVVRSKETSPVEILRLALEQDDGRIEAAAAVVGEDGAALRTAAALAALPVLFCCRRSAAAVPSATEAGHCPVCGAWPALAESRGLDRLRRLRCGRCGSDWGFPTLRCPFCGLSDHRRLGSLVPAESRDGRRVETCGDCRGYVKTIATVSALAPELVPLEDLATVAFDVEAVERGFRRPAPARRLSCELVLA